MIDFIAAEFAGVKMLSIGYRVHCVGPMVMRRALSPANPAPMTTTRMGPCRPERPRLCCSDGRGAMLPCVCMFALYDLTSATTSRRVMAMPTRQCQPDAGDTCGPT